MLLFSQSAGQGVPRLSDPGSLPKPQGRGGGAGPRGRPARADLPHRREGSISTPAGRKARASTSPAMSAFAASAAAAVATARSVAEERLHRKQRLAARAEAALERRDELERLGRQDLPGGRDVASEDLDPSRQRHVMSHVTSSRSRRARGPRPGNPRSSSGGARARGHAASCSGYTRSRSDIQVPCDRVAARDRKSVSARDSGNVTPWVTPVLASRSREGQGARRRAQGARGLASATLPLEPSHGSGSPTHERARAREAGRLRTIARRQTRARPSAAPRSAGASGPSVWTRPIHSSIGRPVFRASPAPGA